MSPKLYKGQVVFLAFFSESTEKASVIESEIETAEDGYCVIRDNGVWENKLVFSSRADAENSVKEQIREAVTKLDDKRARLWALMPVRVTIKVDASAAMSTLAQTSVMLAQLNAKDNLRRICSGALCGNDTDGDGDCGRCIRRGGCYAYNSGIITGFVK